MRVPLWPQVLCALPAGLWIVQPVATGGWIRVPLAESLVRSLAAAVTPPLAGWVLRRLYGGRGMLGGTRASPVLTRLGKRSIRALQIAGGSAAVDCGVGGAFVVEPAAEWLRAVGSPPWRAAPRTRWVVSGAAAGALAIFTLLQLALPLLGTTGIALQFAMIPLAALLVPVVLLTNLIGLWPVWRSMPADRSLGSTGVARPA